MSENALARQRCAFSPPSPPVVLPLPTGTFIVGRYVWAVQAGANRLLQVCEIQVLQPQPWYWQALSGSVNLASNKFAASSAVSPSFSYGDPSNLVDGNLGTTVRPVGGDNSWIMVDLGATYRIDSISIADGAGSNWVRNNATEIVIGDSMDHLSAAKPQCFGPAPITCYAYGTGLPGWSKGVLNDGWMSSSLCTRTGRSSNVWIDTPNCKGSGRYIFTRKRNRFTAASAGGVWYSGMSLFDQCKFALSAATILTVPGCRGPKFCPLGASPPYPNCGGCPLLNSTFCTTAPYTQWTGQGINDASILVIGELAVYGNLQRFQPVARVGAASAVYGSRMIVFGGTDASGFLLNDVQVFNTMTRAWERPETPLGSPPPARAYSAWSLVPSGIAGVLYTDNSRPPTKTLLLFGGVGPASTFSDFAALDFRQCPTLGASGTGGGVVAGSVSCSYGGTLCRYSCSLGFVTNNPSNFVACNLDGKWSGPANLCGPDPASAAMLPGPPVFLGAPNINGTYISLAALSFTVTPPSILGYGTPSFYTFRTAPQFWMQRFYGLPLDVSVWTVGALPPNSRVSNSYSLARQSGFLSISAAPSAMCKPMQQDCQIVHRDIPAGEGLPTAGGDWSFEAKVLFNYQTANAPGALQQIGIGIFSTDTPMSVPNPNNASLTIGITGALHCFVGLKTPSATNNQGGYESFNAGLLNNYVGASQLLNNGITGASVAHVRIDRITDETVQAGVTTTRPGYGSWRFAFRYNPSWSWSYSPWFSDAQVLRPNSAGLSILNPATVRLALVQISGSPMQRGFGEIAYVRFGPLTADPPGPVLAIPIVAGASQLTTTGRAYTAGTDLSFQVATTGPLGRGSFGPASASVPIPFAASTAWNSSTLIEVARGKYAAGVASGGIVPAGSTLAASNYNAAKGVDGVINVAGLTSVPGFVSYSAHTPGTWWYVDLGIPTAVKEITLYNRFDANYQLISSFKIVLTQLTFQGAANTANGGPPAQGVVCDQVQIPPNIPFSSTAEFQGVTYNAAARFNCSWPTGEVGRFLYLINAPNTFLQFREIQVWASNSCPARTATGATQVPGSICAAGSPYGSVCVHTCNAGFTASSGASATTCNGDSWNDPALVCRPECPLLPAPAYTATCSQSIYVENFAVEASVPSAWVALNENYATVGKNIFAANGGLQLNAQLGEMPYGTIAVTTNAAAMAWSGAFTVSASVYTDNIAGLAWYCRDMQNYYTLELDVVSQVHTVKRMWQAAQFTLTSIDDAPFIAANTWVTVSVDVDSAGLFTVTVNGVIIAEGGC